MSKRTVPHCHTNYDPPSLSAADFILKLSSRLSYMHSSHLILIIVMLTALNKLTVWVIRTYSEWGCHMWFTLKRTLCHCYLCLFVHCCLCPSHFALNVLSFLMLSFTCLAVVFFLRFAFNSIFDCENKTNV